MLRLALFAALLVLCVVWLAREANADASPTPTDMSRYMRAEQKWMLGGFLVLIVAIALTG